MDNILHNICIYILARVYNDIRYTYVYILTYLMVNYTDQQDRLSLLHTMQHLVN